MSGVTFEQTKRKYRGRKAETYEAVRRKQERWTLENEVVARYMAGARGSVLDVPVGTGRFIPLWDELGLAFLGVDSSDDMLALARKKMRPSTRGKLMRGDASNLIAEMSKDHVVCVRFLDLIPEADMLRVLGELCRVSRNRIVLTIRLGSGYIHKSNTCTHDRKKFVRAVKRHGWRIDHETPIFGQGWVVMRLVR